ncbi:hypothetical protein SIAM614_17529 [Stappia aggregata IAM 12614]|uniref:Uncharacterized protein n=1 Tax=Roseibium aggregatum (strain ATCC 25650 / DSM 13394 / JCM 20685 / NBRC 16684 / NCIMB 2208 / IAM 12614 / B1) TaxID=384765 RepID=A0P2H2_ROSAI|nr:hypothetical protein [Roseibium aggregatum]EAV40836.1 hypothetical protein SIAM614_17529 [Stappia aggregata IAM 12614] [Roseibium aggregatum IAM 12614]
MQIRPAYSEILQDTVRRVPVKVRALGIEPAPGLPRSHSRQDCFKQSFYVTFPITHIAIASGSVQLCARAVGLVLTPQDLLSVLKINQFHELHTLRRSFDPGTMTAEGFVA